jgi:transcriptional regulator GlxA family with amidase domain
VGRLLRGRWHTDDPLAFDSGLALLLAEFSAHARRGRPAPAEGALRFAPVVEFMRAHMAERLTLERLAQVVGLADQAHLTRAFQRRYGVTPGRYARATPRP